MDMLSLPKAVNGSDINPMEALHITVFEWQSIKEDLMNNAKLIDKAREVLYRRKLTEDCTVGEVSAALFTMDGNIYVGISISAACGIGFCAEHSAIAQMITHGETRIQKLVAISSDGKLLPPCGRCRELLYQVDRGNLKTEIILGLEKTVCLEELLPERWQDLWE
jgi:cytidine deaminase